MFGAPGPGGDGVRVEVMARRIVEQPMRRVRGRIGASGRAGRVGWLVGIALGASCGTAWAQAPREPQPLAIPDVPSEASPRAEGSADGIDALLKLPSGYLEPTGRTVAGAGESEWRRRFDRAQRKLDLAMRTLEATKRELDEVAGTGGASQWSVAPPGATNSGGAATSPLSFKLRQDLLRQREALDEAERALKALRIEADLAGVPVAWRGDANRPIPRRIPEDPR